MQQIKIGTCVPGLDILKWLPALPKHGFETIELYYGNSLEKTDFIELSKKVNEIIIPSDITVASIGLYGNPLQSEEHLKELEYCIDHAYLFGANVISCFAGAMDGKCVEEAIPKFGKVFRELTKRAADQNVKIGIENCPMYGTWHRATCNIGFNPMAWDMMFQEVISDSIGLTWEPTHQMEQFIDPILQLKKWAKKIVYIHGKDATLDLNQVKEYGILGGSDFIYHRTPGFGDSNWRDIISILHMNEYEGDICIEGFHDPVYRDAWEMTGQLHALQYLKWCRGGSFTPNPW